MCVRGVPGYVFLVCTSACHCSVYVCVSGVHRCVLPWCPRVLYIAAKVHGWSLFWLQCLVVTWLLFMFAAHGLFLAVGNVYIAVHSVAVIFSVHRGSMLVAPILVRIISVTRRNLFTNRSVFYRVINFSYCEVSIAHSRKKQ